MDLLANWIGQIIVFILMAVLIDLLIPHSSYRKYIKLVIGLILVLILLSPIFALLQLDIEEELAGWYTDIFEGDEISTMENSIENQKSDIEQTQDAYILEEMVVQLEMLVTEALYEEHQAEISHIEFLFQNEEEKTYEGLEEVIVYVKETEGNGVIIQNVEEIVIPAQETKEKKLDENIAHLLREVWELDDKNITVYWEGGTS